MVSRRDKTLIGLAGFVVIGLIVVAVGTGVLPPGVPFGPPASGTSTPSPTGGPTTSAPPPGGQQAALPPGITERGTNATRLLSAHLTRLRQVSLTVRVRQRLTLQNAAGNQSQSLTLTRLTTTRIADQQLLQRRTAPLATGRRTITHWTTPTGHVVNRTLTRNNTTTTRYLAARRPLTPTRALRLGLLREILVGARFRPTGSQVLNRTIVVRMHAGTITDRQPLRRALGVRSVRAINATALVTPIGVIRRLTVRAAVTGPGGQNATLQLEYRVTAINETTVTRPEWVATAQQRATALNATRVAGGRRLTVTLARGEALPAGSRVVVIANGSRYTATLPSVVEAGDTLSLAVANDTLQVRVGARPPTATGTPFAPTGFQAVIVETPRGVTAARVSLPPSQR